MGTSHPCPGPAGAVGLVSWHPLTAGVGEPGSEGLSCAAGSGFGVGASARINASRCLPEFPGFPCSRGGAEVEAGGTGFVLVLHSHSQIAFKARADAAGRRRLRQRKLPLSRAGR